MGYMYLVNIIDAQRDSLTSSSLTGHDSQDWNYSKINNVNTTADIWFYILEVLQSSRERNKREQWPLPNNCVWQAMSRELKQHILRYLKKHIMQTGSSKVWGYTLFGLVPRGVLWISSDWNDRGIFLGGKFSILGFFGQENFGRSLFGYLDLSRDFWVFKTIWRFVIVPAYPSRVVPLRILMAWKFSMGFCFVLFETLGIFVDSDFCPHLIIPAKCVEYA